MVFTRILGNRGIVAKTLFATFQKYFGFVNQASTIDLADVISEVLNSKIFLGGMPPHPPPKRACFRTLTFCTLRSTVYAPLPVPEQLPYSGYATTLHHWVFRPSAAKIIHISSIQEALSLLFSTSKSCSGTCPGVSGLGYATDEEG